jgi:DNA-binding MarR family transcriptional regulator
VDNGSDATDTRDARDAGDTVGSIELELIKLVRHLETFARRSSLYARLDRASYLALRVLDDLGPVSTNALAQALRLDASTVTRQMAPLERDKLIERRPDPADGRSSTIALTAEGRRAMHDVQHERRRCIEALVSDWDDAEQAGLADALARLNCALVDSVTAVGKRTA